jgi:DNA-binding response OmpR family regulator
MAHILVVDDEELVRTLLEQVLTREGHIVMCAANGDEALRCLREQPTDLMITDLIMPGKEGIETITDARREFPDMKIIAMSGGGRVGPGNYLSLAGKLGADRVFAKPFDHRILVGTVREVLADLTDAGDKSL